MKSNFLVLVAASALSLGNAAVAGEWYVGGALGSSGIDENLNIPGSLINLDDSDTSFRIFGGYQFNDYFGLEGGYIDFGEVGLNAPTSLGPVIASADSDGMTIAAFGRLPIGDRFSMHARLGALMWDANATVNLGTETVDMDSDSGTDAFYGLGFGARLGDHWDLSADYDRYDLGGIKPDVFSISMRYRF